MQGILLTGPTIRLSASALKRAADPQNAGHFANRANYRELRFPAFFFGNAPEHPLSSKKEE